jgi:hypothetical protein
MHIAKLQSLFIDLNDKLMKHDRCTVSERKFIGLDFSTLDKEYNTFKDVWNVIPTNNQTMNLLIEKFCKITLQADKLESAEAMVFVAQNICKKKKKSTKENSGKCAKTKAQSAKTKCHCKQLGLLNVCRSSSMQKKKAVIRICKKMLMRFKRLQ